MKKVILSCLRKEGWFVKLGQEGGCLHEGRGAV